MPPTVLTATKKKKEGAEREVENNLEEYGEVNWIDINEESVRFAQLLACPWS